MDMFDLLRSVWPVLVPTVTVIIAYLGLRSKHKETLDAAEASKMAAEANRDSADLRDERLRNEITGARHEIGMLQASLHKQITDVLNGKLDRMDDKLEDFSKRVADLEISMASLKASAARPRSA